MELSRRISTVGASATIAITTRASELRASGQDVINFGAGEPDFDTPQFIKDAATAALNAGDTKYTPRVAKALREAIADKLRRENHLACTPDQVVVTFGAKHAIYDALQVMLNPRDKVLVPSPYWVSYVEQIKLAGGQPIILKTAMDGGFKVTPRQILDAADGAKAMILNYPSNPTGVMYSRAELKQIAEAVLKTDMVVLSDEIYEKLTFGEAEFVSFASLDDRLPERTITFNGLSKTFAMTGWRLGWACGPLDVISAIRRHMSHSTTSPVSFAQAGALAAYTDPRAPAMVEAMRREFQNRAERMSERLNALPDVRCLPPAGGLYCFPDMSAHYGRTLGGAKVSDSISFAKTVLEQCKVALVPGAPFGEDKGVRLSFACSLEDIDEGLDRIGKLLAK